MTGHIVGFRTDVPRTVLDAIMETESMFWLTVLFPDGWNEPCPDGANIIAGWRIR